MVRSQPTAGPTGLGSKARCEQTPQVVRGFVRAARGLLVKTVAMTVVVCVVPLLLGSRALRWGQLTLTQPRRDFVVVSMVAIATASFLLPGRRRAAGRRVRRVVHPGGTGGRRATRLRLERGTQHRGRPTDVDHLLLTPAGVILGATFGGPRIVCISRLAVPDPRVVVRGWPQIKRTTRSVRRGRLRSGSCSSGA